MSRPKVFFDITIAGQPAGRIVFSVGLIPSISCHSCSAILSLRLLKISDACAPERREREDLEWISASRTQSSTESSLASCFREEISLYGLSQVLIHRISMVLEVNPSMETDSLMRTSACATTVQDSFRWPMLVPIQMGLSSLSPP